MFFRMQQLFPPQKAYHFPSNAGQVASTQGIVTRYCDMSGPTGPSNLRALMGPKTALVMVESPTNPMMRICDIRALAEVAHAGGALLSVDNTLM
jgi:cystathionine beta-lyase